MKLIDRYKVITVTVFLTLSSYFGVSNVTAIERVVAQAVTSNDQKAEADRLRQEGSQKYRQGEVKEALSLFQRELTIRKALNDLKGEATTLNNLGIIYFDLGETKKALEFYSLSLSLKRAVGDRVGEAVTLSNIGSVYDLLGEKQKALEFFNLSLPLSRAAGDRAQEATTLNNIGAVYSNLGDKQKALKFYSLSLSLRRTVGDRAGEANTLSNIGSVYDALGEKQKALEFLNLSLPLSRAVGDRAQEAATLSSIGGVYNALGEKQKALEFLNLSLPLSRAVGDHATEAATLNSIGGVYDVLGEKQKALEFFNLSLPLRRSIGDRRGEAVTLNNIGDVYSNLGEKQKALEYYNQSLPLRRAVGDRTGESTTLNNIGLVHSDLGEKQKALEFYNLSLSLSRAVGNRAGESTTLNNIGLVYDALGEKQKALEYYNQSLPLSRAIGDRAGEAITLNNIGWTLSKQNRSELAIVFYKRSVNITESLRKDIKGLPKAIQQSYVQTVSYSYRTLADLLLKQDRVLEAQQVLDLLKVQELEDYLRNVRGTPQTQQGVVVLRPEQEILDQFNVKQQSAILLGQEFDQLQKRARSGAKLSPTQQQRQVQLSKLLEGINGQFNQFVDSPEVKALMAQLTRTGQKQIALEEFNDLRNNLSNLGNAAMLYPAIFEDRLELIITTPYSPPLRRTVKVNREELNQTIVAYRNVLEHPEIDAKPFAKKLYTWLIQPLEADLKQAGTQSIIYAPDGQLRYIPLAALYDGKYWLAQRFAINNITAASLQKLSTQPSSPLKVFAGAFADPKLTYRFQVGTSSFAFSGLPHAGQEVNGLATSIPGTKELQNLAFNLENIQPHFGEYSVLHFATHAAFLPGQPEDSFILFGDGKRATLRGVQNWILKGVDLVVLSACETGVGLNAGAQTQSDGAEILGLGYQFQRAGARATIASLWSVDDGGTQVLMNTFYALLQKGNISKAEALRQAQAALITANLKALAGQDRGLALTFKNAALPQTVIKRLDHPHYWAPFILIGNGL